MKNKCSMLGCREVAAVRVGHSGCSAVRIYCDTHTFEVLEEIHRIASAVQGNVVCTECGLTIPTTSLEVVDILV